MLIRITADGQDYDAVNELADGHEQVIENRFGKHIFTRSQKTPSQVMAAYFMKEGITVATAESCTGGLIASKFTEIAGISQSYKMGLVTYSNEAKMSLLKVSEATLADKGAVSPKLPGEMCENLGRISGCDMNVSVTGTRGRTAAARKSPWGWSTSASITREGPILRNAASMVLQGHPEPLVA